MSDIQILDSRYWGGVIPASPDYSWIKGYIAKATSGDYFTSPEFYMQYTKGRELFGAAHSSWSFWKAVSDPVASANRYHDAVMNAGGYGGIPPIIDIEDRYAPKSSSNIDRIWTQIQEMELLANLEVMVYSAGWYWDSWVAPWVSQFHPIYSRILWESDPAPDTPIIGWPNGGTMVQRVLDWYAPGFISTVGTPLRIDISDVPEDVFNEWVNPTPPPETETITVKKETADDLREALNE